MKLRDILILLLAVALAVAVALFTRNILREDSIQSEADTVQVLVAKRDLNVGTKIEQNDLTWKIWPKESLHTSYLTKADQKKVLKIIVGSIVRYSIAKSEPIRNDKIIRADDRSLLAAVLAPGKRAFTINLGKRSNVSGLVLPGDYVDVIVADRPSRGEKTSGKTVVSRVRVVATDGKLSYEYGEKVEPPKEISLEVTPHQAERLAAALKEGKPSISVYSLVNLKNSSASSQNNRKKESTQRTISVIRGDEKSSVSIGTAEEVKN
tara:strand:- start:983 stop:1777 length:795 start_codon:yes stop_codon:yes gene_type:complete